MTRMALRLFTLAVAIGLVAAPGSFAAGPWAELHRPLDLPDVAPGVDCPVSSIDQRVDWESANIFGASGIGPGPVYPGLGGGDGEFPTNSSAGQGWRAGKLFWYVSPAYRGRALIRGARLDGAGGMRFLDRNRLRGELRIHRGESVQWSGQPEGSRGIPSGTAIRSSGCYGVQIDGTRFSRTVVFAGTVE
jgi:hypothetical protein